MHTRTRNSSRALGAAVLIALVACALDMTVTVKTPFTELMLHVEGTIGSIPPGLMPGPTVEYMGDDYELFDSNNDGKYDMARKIGETSAVRITPVPASEVVTADLPSHPLPGSPGAGFRLQERAAGIFYVNEPEVPIAFVPTQSAAEYLVEFGFAGDGTVPSILYNVLEPNRARLSFDQEGEIDGLYLDVTLHWDGHLGLPFQVEEFPRMGYNFHNVTDVQGTMGSYWFLQVDGPAESVLSWLSRFGIDEVSAPSATLSQPGQPSTELSALKLKIDAAAGLAHAFEGGRHVLTITLD